MINRIKIYNPARLKAKKINLYIRLVVGELRRTMAFERQVWARGIINLIQERMPENWEIGSSRVEIEKVWEVEQVCRFYHIDRNIVYSALYLTGLYMAEHGELVVDGE